MGNLTGGLCKGGTTLTRKSNMADNIPPKTEYYVAEDLLYRCLHFQLQENTNSIYSNNYAVLRVYDVFALA